MEEGLQITTVVAIAGFIAGLLFGITANRTNFCTMGAISGVVVIGDERRICARRLSIAETIIRSPIRHSEG